VDELSGLQGVVGALGAEAAMRGPAQLLIDKGNESLQGLLIPASPTGEEESGRFERLRHGLAPGGLLDSKIALAQLGVNEKTAVLAVSAELAEPVSERSQ